MTEQEQRIAIAEFCGWENIRQVGTFTGPTVTVGDVPGLAQEIRKELPDYTHSLDAMHEAEKKLTIDKRDIYEDWLRVLTDRADRMAPLSWLVLNATSAQRAEALLRTIGKWED